VADGYDPEAGAAAGAEWFMDYRNADGSVAEMCGNGVRVFGRYLLDHDLVAGPEFAVATRAGIRLVRAEPDGEITVDMGPPQLLGPSHATLAGQPLDGLRISLGNPHLACVVDTPLADFDLTQPPETDAGEFPDGVNLELVRIIGDAHILMRVYERGSGATRSCGTGAVAAAAAAAVAAPGAAGPPPPDATPPPGAGPQPGDEPPSGTPISGAPLSGAGQPSGAGPQPGDGSPGAADGVPSGEEPLPVYPSPPTGDAVAVPPPGNWIVDVPGGRLRVTLDGQTSFLSGPAVIVAEGELSEAWLSGKVATPDQSSPAA
jgi:diaminopimelate epimerase